MINILLKEVNLFLLIVCTVCFSLFQCSINGNNGGINTSSGQVKVENMDCGGQVSAIHTVLAVYQY